MRIEESKDSDAEIVWTNYRDNKFLDKEYEKELQKLEREDEYYYSVYTLGLWTPLRIEGRIYKKYVDKFHPEGNLRRYDYNPQLPLYVCCDFNVAVMKWALIQCLHGEDYVFDEIIGYDTYTEQQAKQLKEQYGNREYIIQGDFTGSYRSTKSAHTEYQMIEEILSNVDIRIKSNPPIMDRINATNWRLCNKENKRRLFVDPRCEHTRKDFMRVCFKEGKHEEEQTAELSHISSAIGYRMEYEYSLKGKPIIRNIR